MLLFQGLNNLAVCILRYRLKLEDAGKTALQQVKWIRKSPSEELDQGAKC